MDEPVLVEIEDAVRDRFSSDLAGDAPVHEPPVARVGKAVASLAFRSSRRKDVRATSAEEAPGLPPEVKTEWSSLGDCDTKRATTQATDRGQRDKRGRLQGRMRVGKGDSYYRLTPYRASLPSGSEIGCEQV